MFKEAIAGFPVDCDNALISRTFSEGPLGGPARPPAGDKLDTRADGKVNVGRLLPVTLETAVAPITPMGFPRNEAAVVPPCTKVLLAANSSDDGARRRTERTTVATTVGRDRRHFRFPTMATPSPSFAAVRVNDFRDLVKHPE